jgi:drug/metabolite transporter (DMT)-like permease
MCFRNAGGCSKAGAMTPQRSDLRAFAMIGLVMLLWAGNSIVGRAVRFDIPPFTLAFVRWTGALSILLPFALGTVVRERAAIARAWKPILLLGISGVACFNGFLYLGLRYTTATNALLLQAAIPALVLILDFLIFRVRSTIGQALGVTLSTIGVVVIVFHGDPHAILDLRFGTGDALILCAVVGWAIYTVCLRLRPAIAPSSFIAVTFLIAAVAMAPLAASEWRAVAAMAWTPRVFGAFAYVAVLPSLVAYFIFNAAVAQIGPARAGQAITLMPLFGALLSALLLGERLHGYHIAGMALILAGIATTTFMAAALARTR